MKQLLISALFLSCVTILRSQTIPNEKVVISVKANTASVSFAVRTLANAPVVCDFGSDEGIKSFPSNTDGTFTKVEYQFVTPSTSERTFTIAADKLMTLRIVQRREVNGVVEVKSNALRNLNVDYVDLTAHDKVDVSLCPNLEVLTLSASGVGEIVLPKSDNLVSVQASPTLLGQGSLRQLNNQDVKNLKQLGVTGASINTLDVSNNLNLETLVFANPKKVLREINGAKALRKLQMLDVRGNALAFDQIPDRYIQDSPIENFRYSGQTSYLVPKSKVQGLTVDLSYLQFARGISTAAERTEFTWMYKRNETAKYAPVPADKVTNILGVFTFDKSLSEDDVVRVYCKMSNPGFPGIGKKSSNTLGTYMIKLKAIPDGITSVTASDAALHVIKTDEGCRIETATPQQVMVFDVNGKTIWTGSTPSNIELKHGVYIVRSVSGEVVKLIK